MVDPYDFIASPSTKKTKTKRKKPITKISKKRKSIQKTNVNLINNLNQSINIDEKENNSNHGFTQLIQTKMMDVKKKGQLNRKNKKINNNNSPLVSNKRPLETENNSHLTTTDPSATCNPRCELKCPASKRRRACLCSKRQLDELEFAPDSAVSQTQRQSVRISVIRSSPTPPPPPALLLPSTSSTLSFPFQTTTIQVHEEEQEEEEEEERENQLHVSSIIAAPLSPAMPLNSTYIANRTIPTKTQLPTTLLTLSTLIPENTTTISHNKSSSSIVRISNVEHSPLLAPTELTSNKDKQHKSISIQTSQCNVSTQTSDDDYLKSTHHQCNDVSLCPCVQIYTRSEQLFMSSMAVFFRNSISVTPPEPLLPIKKSSKKPINNDENVSHQTTPVINQNEIQTEKLIPQSSPILDDNSTVINQTRFDHTKKSDGSSIEININNTILNSSNDQQKFKSLVLTMTGLKDEQKIEFNRFIEYFSVRSSTLVDDTITHVITDEDNENSLICPLTGKVLQGVARHLPIVSYRWLTACLNEKRYIDEIPTYEILGDTIYNKHNGMSRSRLNPIRLLSNYAFHLKCHGCQPFIDNRPLIELIHLLGGLVLKTLNQHIDNIGRQIIILCSKNYLENKRTLQQACQKLNIFFIQPEWLIASIIKFDLQPYEPWLCTIYS